jgi:tripartite-type tricarboxylate transporter receptor subunit TctC
MFKLVRTGLMVLMMAGAATQLVRAQEFPARAVTIIIPNSPGSAPDLMARVVATGMAKVLNQSVIVENKAGAEGIIGLEYVARQMPADGYTLVAVYVPQLVTLPLITRELRFDALRDLPPVAGLGEIRWALSTAASFPWKSFNEMVIYGRANPGKLNFGTSSALSRLTAEALLRDLGISATIVPYKGGSPLNVALASGESHIGFHSEQSAAALGAKLRVLAITGDRRLPTFPDAVTFRELGLPQIQGLEFTFNLRAGTSRPIVDKLYSAVSQALRLPEVRAQLVRMQLDVIDQTPAVAAESLVRQAAFFADIAKKAGLQPQ